VRIRLQTAVAALGALGAGAALVISGEDARRAADQAWPAFVLVTGLLLVGVVAHHDGVFEWAAEALVGLPGSGVTLTAGALGLVAVVTALLNLDTSVVFLTPVLILGARRRAMDERTLLYGAVFMSNAASLFLPGSNLTNLLVLAQRHVSGADFAGEMLPGAVASVVITAVALGIIHRRHLGTSRPSRRNTREQLRGRLGLAASVVAAALIVALPAPAVPVLLLGVLAVGRRIAQRRLDLRSALDAVNPTVVLGLLGIAVALGTLARGWADPSELMRHAGRVESTALGALGAVTLNNLPAAVLLSSSPPAHPRALLVGLNLGPNLFVTGSLSAFLWWQAAHAVGARPSVRAYARQGSILAPAALIGALGALAWLSPGGL